MSQAISPPEAFTGAERELVRREFGQRFSSFPPLSEGIFLKVWRGGPHAGQSKLPPAVQTLTTRGLMEVRLVGRMHRAFFTDAGIDALRRLAADRRFLDPIRYAHIRQELGLGQPSETAPPTPPYSPGEIAHERRD
jgi:hypothetical protein